MSDSDFLILLHKIVEDYLCLKHKVIVATSIEHENALLIEKNMAFCLGVDWQEHAKTRKE